MSTLLHLDASANRTGESVTRRLSGMFAETWRAAHGASSYRYRDLAAEPVPFIGQAFCDLARRIERGDLVPASRVAERIETADERKEWAIARPLIDEVLEARTILIGAPLYNYSVPASLKAWIDRVSFPGAFLDPESGGSRLSRTRVIIVSARGGAYGPGTPREGMDFQTPYLRAYFGKQGVPLENLHFVNAELTLASLVPRLAALQAQAAASLSAARSQVVALANAAV